MDIEKVIVKATSLKAGGKLYLKGTPISKPFPSAIAAELRAVVQGKSDSLEIVERTGDVKITSPPVIDDELTKEEEAPAAVLTDDATESSEEAIAEQEQAANLEPEPEKDETKKDKPLIDPPKDPEKKGTTAKRPPMRNIKDKN